MLFYSIILSMVFGYRIGFHMAKTKWNRKKRWTDGALRMILGVFLYVPIIGTLFQYTFCIKFNIFPSIGVNSPIFDDFISITGFKLIDSLLMGQFLQFFDTVWHLLLPLLTLAVYGISITARWVRKTALRCPLNLPAR